MADGSVTLDVQIGDASHKLIAKTGQSLRDAILDAGLPFDGHCDGEMSCATCGVGLVDDWPSTTLAARDGGTAEMLDAEIDLLDLYPPKHRLACQLIITPAMNGLKLRVTNQAISLV